MIVKETRKFKRTELHSQDSWERILAEYLEAFEAAQSKKIATQLAISQVAQKTADRIEADNNRFLWLENNFLPAIAEANRDLADKCVILPQSLGLSLIYGYHLFIAKAVDPDGTRVKVGAVIVRYQGEVVTNAGLGGPPKLAGSIDDPDTIKNVKSELLVWLTNWAKSH